MASGNWFSCWPDDRRFYLQDPVYLTVYLFWLKLLLVELGPYVILATLNAIIIIRYALVGISVPKFEMEKHMVQPSPSYFSFFNI